MDIKDTIKDTLDIFTGDAASLKICWKADVKPGDTVPISVTVTANDTFRSKGIFIDLTGNTGDRFDLKQYGLGVSSITDQETFQIVDAFTMAENETRTFEGTFQLPEKFKDLIDWRIRLRIETFGNDPDTGYQPFERGEAASD